MELSDSEKQTWYAEQHLLGRVMAVVRCSGPRDRAAVDRVLLDRQGADDGPDVPTGSPAAGTVPAAHRSTRHLGVLVIPSPRDGVRA